MASPKASSAPTPPKQPLYVPTLVYILHHEVGPSSPSGIGKVLGIFSTLKLASFYAEGKTIADPHIYNTNFRAYIATDKGRLLISPRTHEVSVKAGDAIFVAVQSRAHQDMSVEVYPSEEDAWLMCQQYKKSCLGDDKRYYVEEKEWVDEKGRRNMEAILRSGEKAPQKYHWCVEACKVDCLVEDGIGKEKGKEPGEDKAKEMGEDKGEEMEVV